MMREEGERDEDGEVEAEQADIEPVSQSDRRRINSVFPRKGLQLCG